MEKVALNNLKVLCDSNKLVGNLYHLNHYEISTSDTSISDPSTSDTSTSDDTTYDTIYTLNDLEYPIYFTFHQLLNHVHSTYRGKLYGYTRK